MDLKISKASPQWSKNLPQGGFLAPTFQTSAQENHRNLRRPSETEEIRNSLCSNRKNNSTRLIQIKYYKQWVSEHLIKAADLTLRPKVIALFEDANKLLEKLKLEMSGQEENCLILSLVTQAILYPKLLIRYQKTINEKAEFPTRLVIPTMKFTATFTKIGDLGIRRILDE